MEIYNHGCEHDVSTVLIPRLRRDAPERAEAFHRATDDNHNIFPVTDPMCDSLRRLY